MVTSTAQASSSVAILIEIENLVARATKCQPAPKFSNHVDVFAKRECGTERLVANLNLEKLGWGTSIKRLCGRIRYIYVMEHPDETTSQETAAS